MRLLPPTFLVVLVAVAASPAVAAANPSVQTLSAAGTTARPCHTGPLSGTGVVRRTVQPAVDARLTARLDRGGGDWDLTVLDAAGRPLGAAASRSARELAAGVVRAGRPAVVQACRRPGASRTVRLQTVMQPLPRAAGVTLQLVRVRLATEADADALGRLRLDLAEAAGPGFRDAVLHGEADARALRAAGLRFDVVISDLAAHDRAARRRDARQQLRRAQSALPSGRATYRTLADYSAELKGLAAANPGLVRSLTLSPTSLEGRPIEGVEVGADVGAADGRPVFLQLGLHHAREWPSGEHVMEFAHDLVNRFKAGDARVRPLLERARVILVPVVNPDGFAVSRDAPLDLGQAVLDPGGAYRRKNCRLVDGQPPAPGACAQSGGDRGVDLNRNYGMFWGGPGADTGGGSETYRGAGPFSEPESEAIRRLIASRQVVTLITNHTYGNLVLRPPGFAAEGPAPDEGVLRQLGAEMTAANGYANILGHELYDTSGSTEDWSYYATGGLGFTFEIGGQIGPSVVAASFHPAYAAQASEYVGRGTGGNREAYLRALESTASAARHAVITGTGVAGRTLRLSKAFDSYTSASDGFARAFADRLESTMAIPSAGRFEWHVNPSTRPFRRRAREVQLARGSLRIPAGTEAWTLQCETATGQVLGRRDVVVDRGKRVDAGAVCGSAPAFAFTVSKRKLRTALARGLRAQATCPVRCRIAVRAIVTGPTARRLGLTRGRRSVTVARSSVPTSFTGRRTFTLRFGASARRALRGQATVALRVTATATGTAKGAKPATLTRKLTLRR